jgi:hypothetical protein
VFRVVREDSLPNGRTRKFLQKIGHISFVPLRID